MSMTRSRERERERDAEAGLAPRAAGPAVEEEKNVFTAIKAAEKKNRHLALRPKDT